MSLFPQSFRFAAVCLSAGKGLRMGEGTAKVLKETCGWPLLRHVLTNVAHTKHCSSIYTVLSPEIVDFFPWENSLPVPVKKVVQKEAKGTAHALQEACAVMMKEEKNLPILVIPGDSPLYSTEKIISLLLQHQETKAEMSLACAVLAEPKGYGRLVQDGSRLLRIVEEKDASREEKAIQLVNAGLYVLEPRALALLDSIKPSPKTGEYYLTEIVERIREKGSSVHTVRLSPDDIYGVNTPWELSRVGMYLHRRIAQKWVEKGVKLLDPYHTYIDMDVEIGEGTILEPQVYLYGKTKISSQAYIESGCRLENVVLGKKSRIFANSYLQDCTIGEEVSIGPMARVRPGTSIGAGVRIGNFVELKKSQLGERSKIAHLSYVGDAKLGKEVNIGCGFITCNYDGGKEKHETIIGDGAFIGSDVQAVAPISIGAKSYIASGSTLTKNVPEGSLAFARSRQKNKNNYGKKLLCKN